MGNKSSASGGGGGSSNAVVEAGPSEEELQKMKPSGRKGWKMRVEASKKLASRSPFGREDRLEAAAELAEQAATQFKLAKMYEDAAACYKMQAVARTRMSEDMQACNALIMASEMFAKSDAIEEAYEAANKAIEKYKDGGKFDRAAKHLQKVAEVSLGVAIHQKGDGACDQASADTIHHTAFLRRLYPPPHTTSTTATTRPPAQVLHCVSTTSIRTPFAHCQCLTFSSSVIF